MIDEKDFFQNYIEDDQTFDDYIREMQSNGEWGGNLEIQVFIYILYLLKLYLGDVCTLQNKFLYPPI